MNGLYYIMSGVAGFCWFVYSENLQQSRLVSGKRNLAICFLPVLALIGLTIASYWTGELFYIDENNTYHRGNLYVFQVLIAFSYMGFTACKALVLALRKENYVSRSKYLTLASFVVMPFVFGTAQALLGGSRCCAWGLRWACCTFILIFRSS